ncbi:hypothetical protein Tco_0637846 [Tanacetum coccineum]
MKDRCSEKQVLGYMLIVGVTTVEWESRLQKSITIDVHQVGDEREVTVLRSFNWPPSELIMEDGVLPKKGYSQFNDVSLGYLCVPYVRRYRKVSAVALLKGRGEAYCGTGFEGRIVGCKPNPTSFSTGRAVGTIVQFGMIMQFSTGRAVWHDHALWPEPEQFSSELNNISLV